MWLQGIEASEAPSSGNSVWRRKATTIASSASVSTVERGSFGPVFRSSTVARFRHWDHFFLTLWRVLAAFIAASAVGAVIGLVIGLNERAEAFFQPLLALALAVPDPVYIIFAILALGTGETAGFVALTIAVVPFVTNIVRSNVHATGRWTKWRRSIICRVRSG